MSLLEQAGVPVPRYFLIRDRIGALTIEYPASIRPRLEPDAKRWIVRNRRTLRHAVRRIRTRYGQDALVEEIVRGRRISISLLGNETIECLPLVEQRSTRKICPASLEDSIADRIRMHARTAYRVAGCRDYGRVDIRLPPSNEPVVTDVKWVDVFARHGAFMTAAEAVGYGFRVVTPRIVNEAARRYLNSSKVKRAEREATSVVSLARRRAAVG